MKYIIFQKKKTHALPCGCFGYPTFCADRLPFRTGVFLLLVIAFSQITSSSPGEAEGCAEDKRLVLSWFDCAESSGAGPMKLRRTGR